MKSIVTIEATKAKQQFAQVQNQAQTEDVAVTRHGQVDVYVVSARRYRSLTSVADVGAPQLQQLEAEFDEMVAKMQTPAHERAAQDIMSLPLSEILALGALRPERRSRKIRPVTARKPVAAKSKTRSKRRA